MCILFFFFFQAEDGIRYGTVTGVQTCALPIYSDSDAADSKDAAGTATDGDNGDGSRADSKERKSGPLCGRFVGARIAHVVRLQGTALDQWQDHEDQSHESKVGSPKAAGRGLRVGGGGGQAFAHASNPTGTRGGTRTSQHGAPPEMIMPRRALGRGARLRSGRPGRQPWGRVCRP